MSLECGIHVFVQSPLTHTVWESRQLKSCLKRRNYARKWESRELLRILFVKRLNSLQAGRLGEIKEIHVWTNKPSWPQAPYDSGSTAREEQSSRSSKLVLFSLQAAQTDLFIPVTIPIIERLVGFWFWCFGRFRFSFDKSAFDGVRSSVAAKKFSVCTAGQSILTLILHGLQLGMNFN